LTLKDAAAQYSVSDKYVRMASALLLSRMTHLVWEVDSGLKPLRIAYGEYRTVLTGDRSNDPGPEGLYLIAEEGSVEWWKIGIGRVAQRFDDLQQGNPRELRLVGFWRFESSADAKGVETRLFDMCAPTDGGSEWRKGVDYDNVYQMAVQAGGEWLVSVPGFDQAGLRENRSGWVGATTDDKTPS
jgi:hypothetical protein